MRTAEEIAERYFPREGALDGDRVTGTYGGFLGAIVAAVCEAQADMQREGTKDE